MKTQLLALAVLLLLSPLAFAQEKKQEQKVLFIMSAASEVGLQNSKSYSRPGYFSMSFIWPIKPSGRQGMGWILQPRAA
jgi:hypothetical protein